MPSIEELQLIDKLNDSISDDEVFHIPLLDDEENNAYLTLDELFKESVVNSNIEQECIYKPNKKQQIFHASSSTYTVYGGAKGGGKTAALYHDAYAYAIEYPGADIYIFRETYDQLEANIIRPFRKQIPDKIDGVTIYKYNDTKHTITFFNGSTIFFRYMSNMKEAERFQGYSMDYVAIDELTLYKEEMIEILLSCLRSAKGFPVRFRGTCNPGKVLLILL